MSDRARTIALVILALFGLLALGGVIYLSAIDRLSDATLTALAGVGGTCVGAVAGMLVPRSVR